jgi:Integrase core domain
MNIQVVRHGRLPAYKLRGGWVFPRSPTTTGKVERFHKTLKRGCLEGRVFADLDEAQAVVDTITTSSGHIRGSGWWPPWERFRLADPDTYEEPAPESVAPSTEEMSGDDGNKAGEVRPSYSRLREDEPPPVGFRACR